MSPEVAGILLNKEVIAVDQNAKGVQGTRVKKEGDLEIWSRPLADGSHAAVLFNRGLSASEITVLWKDLGWKDQTEASIRDLWVHRDLGRKSHGYTAKVPAHGVVMIKVKPSLN